MTTTTTTPSDLTQDLHTVIIPTEEQHHALDLIHDWHTTAAKQEFKLGGYAGTGKTTIVKTLLEQLHEKNTSCVVCAFTGKAVNVLQRKGIRAQTIHSLIYDCHQDPKTKELIFERRVSLPSNPKLIIVDEASMISTDLYNDLKSYKIKLLFVGDPGQLEPVGDNPNLMAAPDYVLSRIHRQAESSPIITLANKVRLKQGSSLLPCYSLPEQGLFIRNKAIKSADIVAVSQLICAKNQTRQSFNQSVRDYLGFQKNILQPKDKIIVLRNNLNFGVFNGMILFVDEIVADSGSEWKCNLHDEVGNSLTLPIWKDPFFRVLEKNAYIPKKLVYCDFAYAITCHKSQGSEWDSVMVFDEWMPPQVWDMARWRYTAITRAAKQLTYLI